MPAGRSSLSNAGPHGLSEILYAFTSAAANKGSAFAGLNANTVFYNLMLGLAMLIGRFAIIFPALAIAGSLVDKKIAPPSAGTFSTDSGIFAVLLIAVIMIVGALTFLPGPFAGTHRRTTFDDERVKRFEANMSSVKTVRKSLESSSLRDAFKKLNPRTQYRNPVMFVTLIGAVLTTIYIVADDCFQRLNRLRFANRHLALVHGSLRELRRSTR